MSIVASLSHDLLIPEKVLSRLISSAPHRYKVYQVDKKSGQGKRTIAQPARSVKALQRWVMANLLDKLPVHDAAAAYVIGRNIVQNAAVHAPQRFLMKLDFQDFFPSMTAEDLQAYLDLAPLPDLTTQDVVDLKKILFWNRNRAGRLVMSIGAPSSPMLSNILMFRFDETVQGHCSALGVIYTRYADDLTFSTDEPNVLTEVKHRVEQICLESRHPTLRLNERKTVHASRANSRRVTGLVLSNEGTVSLGRDRKRVIRAGVHHFIKGGMDLKEIAHLQGMLAFVHVAEPDFLNRLTEKYGVDVIKAILTFKKQG